ncbi:MAG: hypothetical protein JXR63_07640 [Spirochaetales bacterium]|nr:hypothetical protein [Spirochaetales bacterium]
MKKILFFTLSGFFLFFASCNTESGGSSSLSDDKASAASRVEFPQSVEGLPLLKMEGFENPFPCENSSGKYFLGCYSDSQSHCAVVVLFFIEKKKVLVLDSMRFDKVTIEKVLKFQATDQNLLYLSFFRDKKKENLLVTRSEEKLRIVINFPSALNQKVMAGDFLENGGTQLVILFSKTEVAGRHNETIVSLYEFRNNTIVKTQGFGLVESLEGFLSLVAKLIYQGDYMTLSKYCDSKVSSFGEFLDRYSVYREERGDLLAGFEGVVFRPISENPYDIYLSKRRAEFLFKVTTKDNAGSIIFSIPIVLSERLFSENKFIISQ